MVKSLMLLLPAYVVRREGNVLTRVCPSIHLPVHGGGGVPISHNALQHCPECHGADTGGVPISHNALQHYPEGHGADTGGGTLPGQDGGGYPPGRVPSPPPRAMSGREGGGYPVRTTEGLRTTRRTLCLLRSRRRTFLLNT